MAGRKVAVAYTHAIRVESFDALLSLLHSEIDKITQFYELPITPFCVHKP